MGSITRRRKRKLLLPLLLTTAAALWLLLVYFTLWMVERRVVSTPATPALVAVAVKEATAVVVNGPTSVNNQPWASILTNLMALGYEREAQFDLNYRSAWRWPNGSCPMAAAGILPLVAQSRHAPIAYLTFISNEKFVDGALVLGASLRNTSRFLQHGVADLVVMATVSRISEASRRRLLNEGGYTHVFEVPSLAQRVHATSGLFRDTLDKIYMFNLTMYEKLVYMDADMIAIRSMDSLFSRPRVRGPDYVAAVGGKGYFQTGMMIIIPTQEMFNCIYDRLIRGTPPNGRRFIGSSARDGALLRDVFQTHFHPINPMYSRNLNPRYRVDMKIPGEGTVVAVHLRGIIKPWFDRRLPNLQTKLGKKEFGFTYLHWWTLYEEKIHKKSAHYVKMLQMQSEGRASGSEAVVVDGIAFGMDRTDADGTPVSPLTHVWMQRYSEDAYTQLLSSEEKRRRNRTMPSMQKIPSPTFGLSCDAVCAQRGLRCVSEALYFTSLNDCAELQSVFGCRRCELGVYWRQHPGSDFPALEEVSQETENKKSQGHRQHRNNSTSLVCRYNYLHDERGLPNCTASHSATRRYCPCVPVS
ncbi:putative glycosyl transferase [Trypanosoma rangeli]|uniref:Putative glycosyl transferase n=1 Tax=Trypanosoma rangeli TaxID=5698 RepID=A0A3R7MQL2_TRYRA|nr:putative glycosyl transferase [Trypanosoma rangeli]RNF09692.1 putative glycosyl transferase [Trypanosoma rangeli]|eukprot:RNF09692.1 putative glycosyl transferase [Trypanosoma rangeli]